MLDDDPDDKGKRPDCVNFRAYEYPRVEIFKFEDADSTEDHKHDPGENNYITRDLHLTASFYPPKHKAGRENRAQKTQKRVNNGEIKEVGRFV